MTSEETETETYFKFDGKDPRKFQDWAAKTRSVAARKGWLGAITKDVTLNRASTTNEDKAAVLMNDLAYHYLMVACTDNAFQYVRAAEDANYNGNARKAWVELCRRYDDVTESDLIALTTEYNNCKMKKASDDPHLWYVELEHIMLKMERAGAQKKTEVEQVAFIMSQIPAEYEIATSALWVKPAQERTLKLVKNVYLEYWAAKFKNAEVSKEQNGNVALYTEGVKNGGKNNWKKFKGTCNYCGIQGHKSVDCCKKLAAEKLKTDEGGTKPAVDASGKKCFRCKEKGHIAKDCPTRKKNQADALFVGMVLSDAEARVEASTPEEKREHEREDKIASLDAETQFWAIMARLDSNTQENNRELQAIIAGTGRNTDEDSEEDTKPAAVAGPVRNTQDKANEDTESEAEVKGKRNGLCQWCGHTGPYGDTCDHFWCHQIGRKFDCQIDTASSVATEFLGRCTICGDIREIGDECQVCQEFGIEYDEVREEELEPAEQVMLAMGDDAEAKVEETGKCEEQQEDDYTEDDSNGDSMDYERPEDDSGSKGYAAAVSDYEDSDEQSEEGFNEESEEDSDDRMYGDRKKNLLLKLLSN